MHFRWKGSRSFADIVSVCVVCALATGLPAAPGAAQTMQDELQVLLNTNPRLQSASKTVDATKEGVREARSGYFPTVSVSGDVGPQWVDSPTRRASQADPFTGSRKSSTLTITENLFSGYRTDGQTRIARLREDVASLNLDITRQTLLYNGVRAYLEVLKQSELLKIARANERTLKTEFDAETARLQQGSGLAVDVLQAQSRLELAREQAVTILGDLRTALSSYIELFGHPAVPTKMALPPLPSAALPETQEAAISIAGGENSALIRSKTQIDIADEQRTVARSTYWPKVDLVGEGSWENDVDGVDGVRREGKLILRASWDIFDGFLTEAKSGRAAAEYGAALDTRNSVDRDVRNRVRSAWHQYRTTADQMKLLKRAVDIAAQVFEARKKLRQRGRETVTNVLDAENELNNTRLRYSQAVYDNALAAFRLLLQIGRLTPETLELKG